MNQESQALVKLENDLSRIQQALLQVITQETAYFWQQWDHLLGIDINPSVPQTGSNSGSGNGFTLRPSGTSANQNGDGRLTDSGSRSNSRTQAQDTANTSVQPLTASSVVGSGAIPFFPQGNGTVTGEVWHDSNSDGLLDNGESGMSGITVNIDTPQGGVVSTTTTDANGNYQFQLNNGLYNLPQQFEIQVAIPSSDQATLENVSGSGVNSNINSSGYSAVFTLAASGTQQVNGGLIIKPVAKPDSYSLIHDTTLSIPPAGVLANDVDYNGLPLSAVQVSNASHGTVALNSNGSFLYTPNAGYSGTDSFAYYATDGVANSSNATVSLTITNSGTITAQADSYSVLHDQVLSVTAANSVLGNDSDSDGDPLTAVLASGPGHGTLQLNNDGSFTYTPNAGYVGSDSFTYKASDGANTSAATTVTISVTDHAPTASNHSYGVPENKTVNVSAVAGLFQGSSDADNDPLALSNWTQPSHGTLQVNPDGSFSYTPNTNYTGTDSFQYTISDGALTATATVTLTVHATDNAPVANPDSYSVERNNEFYADTSTGVLVNDTDADGDPLTAMLVSGPTNGTLTLNAAGSFDYMPNTNFIGTDTFTYEASDGTLTSQSATVTLTVGGSPPIAANQTFAVKENTTLNALAGALLLNDQNPDSMTLTAQDVSQPQAGQTHLILSTL